MPVTMAHSCSGTVPAWCRLKATHHKLVTRSYSTKQSNILTATLKCMTAGNGCQIFCNTAFPHTAMRPARHLSEFIDLAKAIAQAVTITAERCRLVQDLS